MKTRYSRHHSFLSIRTALIALVFVIVIAFLLLVRTFLPGVFTAVASPVWQLGATASAIVSLPESSTTLRAERDSLRAENTALLNENRTLTERLANVGTLATSPEGVIAGVLARPPLTPYDVLVVQAGSSDGILNGARAYAIGGIPVGVVAEVTLHTSRVILYSASGQTTDAWVTDKHLPLTLVGHGAGTFTAEIARDSEISAGDTVFLAGEGAVPAGTVVSIDGSAASPTATVRIRPFVNPFTITNVVLVSL